LPASRKNRTQVFPHKQSRVRTGRCAPSPAHGGARSRCLHRRTSPRNALAATDKGQTFARQAAHTSPLTPPSARQYSVPAKIGRRSPFPIVRLRSLPIVCRTLRRYIPFHKKSRCSAEVCPKRRTQACFRSRQKLFSPP